MNQYELYIECKACREENHEDCSGGRTGSDNIVQIRCTCLSCKKKRNRQSIMKNNDVCVYGCANKKNSQALESVGGPVANAIVSSFQENAQNDYT